MSPDADEAKSDDVADRRAAVDMSVKLSAQLVATSAGMLAVEGAFVTYALGAREVGALFFVASFIAAVCFVLSIYWAGRAISKARKAGFEGKWSLREGRDEFNRQALFNVGAIVTLLFCYGAFLGSTKISDRTAGRIEALEREVEGVSVELRRLKDDVGKTVKQLGEAKPVEVPAASGKPSVSKGP